MGSYNFVCPQFSGILNPLDGDGLIGAFPWLVVRPTDVIKQKELEEKHSMWSGHSNLFRAGVLDPTNVYSSSEYRAHKFCFILDGRVFEVQFVLIEDAINEIVAHGRENHLVYKTTAYMDGLFPDFFPYELYRIDWSAEPVRRRLIEHQLAKF